MTVFFVFQKKKGLSDKKQTCFVISDDNNLGDGQLACQSDDTFQKTYTPPTGYSIRDTLDLVRLDSLVDEDIWLLKIDVEGFEPSVFAGATRLIETRKIHYLFSEVSHGMMKDHGYDSADYIKFLRTMGFSCSLDSFDGPYFVEV